MILVSPSPWKKIIKNWGQNVALGQLGDKIMSLHSKTENDHWNMRVNKRIMGAEKVNYKQQTTVHHSGIIISIIKPWSPFFSLIIYQRNYIWSSNIRSTNLEAFNAQICKYIKHHHSYTSSCTKDPLGSCISYIACIHLHTYLKYFPCMVKEYWLYKYSVTNIQN